MLQNIASGAREGKDAFTAAIVVPIALAGIRIGLVTRHRVRFGVPLCAWIKELARSHRNVTAMRTLTKYVLVQMPGWLLIDVLLIWLWPKTRWRPWIAVAAYAAWVIKDFLLYPLLRSAYEQTKSPTGGIELIGRRGVARDAVDPEGYISVAGELWRAEPVPGEAHIPGGARVRVQGASGLTLYVTREREEQELTRT